MQRLAPRTGSGVPQPAESAEGRIVGEEDWQRCRRILEASAIRQGRSARVEAHLHSPSGGFSKYLPGLKRNFKITPALLETYGMTENCTGCRAAVEGLRRNHTDECRRRVEQAITERNEDTAILERRDRRLAESGAHGVRQDVSSYPAASGSSHPAASGSDPDAPRTGSGVPQPAEIAEERIVGEEDWQRCRRKCSRVGRSPTDLPLSDP